MPGQRNCEKEKHNIEPEIHDLSTRIEGSPPENESVCHGDRGINPKIRRRSIFKPQLLAKIGCGLYRRVGSFFHKNNPRWVLVGQFSGNRYTFERRNRHQSRDWNYPGGPRVVLFPGTEPPWTCPRIPVLKNGAGLSQKISPLCKKVSHFYRDSIGHIQIGCKLPKVKRWSRSLPLLNGDEGACVLTLLESLNDPFSCSIPLNEVKEGKRKKS